jgi:cytochrome c553
LELLREPLQQLADYDYADLAPSDQWSWIASMQETARLTAEAVDLERAAAGVAALAAVCGQCHAQSEARPTIRLPALVTAAPDDEYLDERMFRHMDAADLMWTGLAAPSDTAWQLGADTLAGAPSDPPLSADSLPEGFIAALADLRALGQRAQIATAPDERATLYGLLLARCAGCHVHAVELVF